MAKKLTSDDVKHIEQNAGKPISQRRRFRLIGTPEF